MDSSQPISGRVRLVAWVVCAAAFAAGAAARIAAAATDLWLDEVWTFQLLPRIDTPLDVFFELRHANNHPLNTLYLWWLGDRGGDFVAYRGHSLLAGLGVVVLGGAIGARRGLPEAVFATLLTSGSFLLVHHASQARGYSMMLLGAYAAFYAMALHLERPRAATAIGFFAGVAVGFLSNLYFIHCYVALGLWSLAASWRQRGSFRATIAPMLRLHLAPAGVASFVYLLFYWPGLTGTQFRTSYIGILTQAGSLPLGGDFVGTAASWVALAAIVAWAFGLAVVWRRRPNQEWLFWLLATLVSPGLILVASQPKALFVRFFAISDAFLILLLAFGLGELWRRGLATRLFSCIAVVAILLGNARHIDALIERGRGQYVAALHHIAANTPGARVTIGSDHKFGTGVMIKHYRPLVPDKSLVYLIDEDPAQAPEWLILLGEPRGESQLYAGRRYSLERAFYASGFGFHWTLYRRAPRAPAP